MVRMVFFLVCVVFGTPLLVIPPLHGVGITEAPDVLLVGLACYGLVFYALLKA